MAKLYPGMAFTNIKSNRKTYIPYMLSCADLLTIALFYIIGSLGSNEGLSKMWAADTLVFLHESRSGSDGDFRSDLPVLHQQFSDQKT